MPKNFVALATDANYSQYLEVVLYQLGKHSPWQDVCILVDGTDELAHHLAQRAKDFGLSPLVIRVDEMLSKYPSMKSVRSVTRTTFARLFLVELLPVEVERVLYLDLDILILRSLAPICDFDLQLPLAAYGYSNHLSSQLFGNADVTYFNAGVLLIDAKAWQAVGAFKQFETALASKPDYKFQDQDLLNLVFRDNWQPLPITANMPEAHIRRKLRKWDYVEPLIVHFTGFGKPWIFSRGVYMKKWRTEAAAAGVKIGPKFRTKIRAFVWVLIERLGHTTVGSMLFRMLSRDFKNLLKAKI